MPLKPFLPNRPFQFVGTDFMGPFKESKEGKKYIMIVTDMFTKWTEAYALDKCDAKTTAKCLFDGWIFRYGPPDAILSD